MDRLQRLWAPWRFGYIEGGTPIEGCPFCVLPDRDDDRANLILYRGEHSYVICNAYPYNPGHVMVCSNAHVADLDAVDPETSTEIWDLTRKCVEVLRDGLAADGTNVGINLGTAAGAGISDHLHVHVIPRWTGDTNFISVAGATRVLPRALEDVYDELRRGFN